MPGTWPRTSSDDDFTSNPPPAFGPNSTVRVVSGRCGAWPPCASAGDSAMLKQLAWEAATDSSGVVLLATPSVRAFQLRFTSRKVPLAAVVFPLPDIRSPSQYVVARLCMIAPPCAGALCQTPGALATPVLPEHGFRSMLAG